MNSKMIMTSHRSVLGLAAVTLMIGGIAPSRAAEAPSLEEIAVGGAGGFDYLYADGASRRLYVSHGTVAVVLDADKFTVVGEVADTPGIHGIAIAPELKRGFTSNGREAKVSMFDSTPSKPSPRWTRVESRCHPLRAGTTTSLRLQRPRQ